MKLFTFVCSWIGFLCEGYVVTILWKWFLTNNLHWHSITYPIALGMDLIGSLLLIGPLPSHHDEETNEIAWIIYLVRPWLCLLIGWIVTWFM
jgi:hypothetical protein